MPVLAWYAAYFHIQQFSYLVESSFFSDLLHEKRGFGYEKVHEQYMNELLQLVLAAVVTLRRRRVMLNPIIV